MTRTNPALTTITAIAWATTVAWGSLTLALYDGTGAGPISADVAETIITGFPFALVATLAIHLVTVWRTGRARAAMAGAVGGLMGATLTAGATMATGWVPEQATDELASTALVPAAAAMVACALIWLRALLAERGTWRYPAPDLGTGWE